ncbi:MAG: Arc family DNA-binding protein [Treponemataceae bacterium]|nr:Arc family DNA-binding protein [Treponemataceae bacterium]
MAEKDDKKKQIILRISPALWEELAAWADDEFRSINGQIEYLLTECVRQRRKKGFLLHHEKIDQEKANENGS